VAHLRRRTGQATTPAVLVAGLVLLSAGYARADVYERYKWAADDLTGSCGPQPAGRSCQPLRTLAPNTAGQPYVPMLAGRIGSGLKITPQSGGFSVRLTQDYSPSLGFAYSAFVWLNADPTTTNAIFWQEAPGTTGIAVYVNAGGTVSAQAGHQGQGWTCPIISTATLGKNAWHHVALVWDTVSLRLLLNGVQEGSTACAMPDQSAVHPVSFGARHIGGTSYYVLDGALDEIKYFQFDPSSYQNASGDPFVLQEHGLYLRRTVLSDLGLSSSPDLFKSPTFEATSRLRALVSGFFLAGVNDCAPLDPLGPANPAGPLGSGVVAYVHPNAELSVVPAADPVVPGGCVAATPKPGSVYTNSLYDRLKTGRTSGYCGAASFTLFAVYRAFGYAARRFDVLNAPIFSYTDSHSTTDVYVTDAGGFVLQDATYNISGLAGSGEYYSATEIFALARPGATLPAFSDNGYTVTNQRWPYTGPAVTSFFGSFVGLYAFWPSWAY
jgi:hypothetical protein